MKKLLLPFLFAFTSLAQPSRVVLVSPPLQDPLINSTDLADFRSRIGIPTVAATNLVFVNTISDVAAYSRTDGLPEFIATKGFAAVGDRGGAVYQWVNSSAPTNIYRIACPSGGRWVETDYLNRWVCNVLKAGATPFDTTDDTAAIQRAFDAAAQQSSGAGLTPLGDEPVVYFPAGKYYLNDTVQYAASSRDNANIAIRGDGIWNTHLVANHTFFPEGGNKPMLYIQNVRLNISDLRIRSTSGILKDYRITGLHLKDCDYGVIRDVAIGQVSRGIVVDCGAMNWNTFRGLQFEANYIDVFAAGAQGLTGEWHSTSSGHTWFGPANGLNLDIQCEGAGQYSEFTPAGIYIPSGNDIYTRWGYNESSKAPLWLGVPLTNRVTIAVNGTTATMTFTNAHYYSTGYTFTIQAEQSVPQDIQDYIVGSRTVASANRTNNYLTFTTGGTVTSDPSPYTFLAILDMSSHGVMNSILWAKNEYNDTLPIMLDKVKNIEIFGSNTQFYRTTKRSRGVTVKGVQRVTLNDFFVYDDLSLGPAKHPPLNVFPDPWLTRGTNWIGPNTYYNAAAVVPTNYLGRSGFLIYVPSKPTSSYLQARLDWNPVVPMSVLNGQRAAAAFQVIELNHPSWRPSGFTVNSGGSGYANGTATVSHGGRTVEVNLTTSGGAITAATWRFGAFVTNDSSVANLDVVQAGGSGGVITPTGFTDYSAYAKRGSRSLTMKAAYRGESTSTLLIEGTSVGVPANFYYSPTDNIMIGGSIRGLYGPIDGSKAGFRLLFTDTYLDSNNAVGTEAYFISFLGFMPGANMANNELLLNNWFARQNEWATTYRRGVGYYMPYNSDVSSIFATNDVSSVTTLGLVTSGGGSGLILHYIGAFTADPSGTFAVGSVYRNTSTSKMRFWTGSAWTDF